MQHDHIDVHNGTKGDMNSQNSQERQHSQYMVMEAFGAMEVHELMNITT